MEGSELEPALQLALVGPAKIGLTSGRIHIKDPEDCEEGAAASAAGGEPTASTAGAPCPAPVMEIEPLVPTKPFC